MLKSCLFKAFLLFLFAAVGTPTFAQKAYQVSEIPDPKNNGGGWVSNPDGILSPEVVSQVNSTISAFEQKTNVQVAVVIVNDFEKNKEDFDFAHELFNTWGIGQKTSDNGLLLFIAKNRRKYRFITGTGAEGVLPDVKLKHIAKQNLLPAFKENDFGTGIINTIQAIGNVILKPDNKAELNQFFTQPEAGNTSTEKTWLQIGAIAVLFFIVFKLLNRQAKNIPVKKFKGNNDLEKTITNGCAVLFIVLFIGIFALFLFAGFDFLQNIKLVHAPIILYVVLSLVLFFSYLFYTSSLRKAHNDDENFFEAVTSFNKKNFWLVIFSPLILIPLFNYLFRRSKNIDRFKPILDDKKKNMIRVDRDINIEGKPFLSLGQRKEETIKAYDYDIWESEDHKQHIIKQWPAEEYNAYTECPECNFRTYQLNKQVTITAATYSHDGKAKLINECSFCKKSEFINWVTLAMLVESKSSSGSSSSGGSSSSSSSSSSSWGGGSSSGGGTGGSW